MPKRPDHEDQFMRVQSLELAASAGNHLKTDLITGSLINSNYLETLYNSLGEALFTVKLPERTIEYANASVEIIFGYFPGECIGHTTAFLHPSHAAYDEFGKKIRHAVEQKKERFCTEHRLRKKNGQCFPAETTTSFIKDSGRITHVISLVRDISDRKRSQKELKNQELKFRLMAESIKDVFWMSTLGVGEMLYISPAYEKVWGRSLESLYRSPQSFLEVIHPDDRQSIIGIIQGAHRDGQAYECEYRIVVQGGERWIYERGFPVRHLWEGKEIMTGICTDITEQKLAEKAIRESETRFRQLFEHTSSGVAVYENIENGKNFIFKNLNKSGEKIDRISRDKAVGRRITDVFPAVAEFGLLNVMRRVWQTGEPERLPVSFYKDGRIKGWRDNYVYKLATGEIVTIYSDITERKQYEESLRQSEERFRELAEMLPETIFEMDVEGNLTFVNQKAFTNFKYTPSDLDRGLKILDMIAAEDRPAAESNMARMFKGEKTTLKEYHALRKDGTTFPALAHSSAIFRDGKPVGLRGFLIDVSEKKKLEAQILQTQKMESIGLLAGGIAHDFNNILSSIIGFTQLAMKDAGPGSIQEDNLQEVAAASKRAKDLIWQILTFARQTDERIEPIQVESVAKEVLKFIRSSIPSTINIEQDIDSRAFVMANPTQIHQIVMNLCTNAAQAMDESGGRLNVAVKDVMIKKRLQVADYTIVPGEYIKITVADTGDGIPPEIRDTIFEPYFTTKGVGEGTGMGLAVVQGIVKKSGGTIIVESGVGEGTTFKIYLPAKQQQQVSKKETPMDLPTGNERILFVDDEPAITKMGNRLLAQLGYSVEASTNSLNALKCFKEKSDIFDLVITDMTMPGMRGDNLAIELMKIRPDIPVILCTGFSKKISEKLAYKIGIKAIIYKPFAVEELAAIVRNVLDDALC